MVNDSLSNEEYAVMQLKKDMNGALDEADMKFMEENILATSFGQNNKASLPEGKQDYYRPYEPKTESQKLLALADVSGFTKGWEGWVDESLRLLEETPGNTPKDVDAWIKTRDGFVNYYIFPLLKSVKDLLSKDYYDKLESALNSINKEITALKDEKNPMRKDYEKKLKDISEKE